VGVIIRCFVQRDLTGEYSPGGLSERFVHAICRQKLYPAIKHAQSRIGRLNGGASVLHSYPAYTICYDDCDH